VKKKKKSDFKEPGHQRQGHRYIQEHAWQKLVFEQAAIRIKCHYFRDSGYYFWDYIPPEKLCQTI